MDNLGMERILRQRVEFLWRELKVAEEVLGPRHIVTDRMRTAWGELEDLCKIFGIPWNNNDK